MGTNTAQEDGLAIQQQLTASRLNGAETNLVLDQFIASGYLNMIQFRRLGRP